MKNHVLENEEYYVIEEGRSGKMYKGLTSAEVEESRRKYGSNILTPPPGEPWWKLYLEKFNDPIIRILIIAAVIATGVGIFEGNYSEGVGIIIAILLATTMAFYNEFQAKKEFEILNRVNDDVPVKVMRDGLYGTVPKKDLVVGDLVILETGEEVPADGELVEAVSFRVDESSLTGESKPVKKMSRTEAENRPLEESTYPVYKVLRGTTVKDGYGKMVVTEVGDFTEIGKIAKPPSEESVETPLNIQLSRLSKVIGVFGFSVAALTFAALVKRGIITKELSLDAGQWFFVSFLILGILVMLSRVWIPIFYDALELLGKNIRRTEEGGLRGWGKAIAAGLGISIAGLGIGLLTGLIKGSPANWLPYPVMEEFLRYFMISVTIIVVSVPEGLPMSVTLSLAYSMREMMKSKMLVRRMHACETIGATTVICTDKTGTLTINEMRVYRAIFPVMDEKALLDESDKVRSRIIEAVTANTTANLSKVSETEVSPVGNPTECALLLWLHENGVDYSHFREKFSVYYQWPFNTDRKYMATLGKSWIDGKLVLHVKGAPEIILDRCTKILTSKGIEPLSPYRKAIDEELQGYQKRGMRTLGFAYRHYDLLDVSDNQEAKEISQLASDMIWLGYVAIIDPVRKDVAESIKLCRQAGIDIKIVTGDNPYTAKEIAVQAGLLNDGEDEAYHLTGAQFNQMDEKEALEIVPRLKILSRARPMDKFRLVHLLQKRGEIVAVTGDGVNDVPALLQAHVGLAMGKSGTHAAREASDIILLDDSFHSITNAVMWGRSLYQNIQKFILFQLTINVTALFVALIGPFIGVKIPLTIAQMLWVNLIMDTFAALALATEPPHREVMYRPPRDPRAFILKKDMVTRMFITASAFLAFCLWYLRYIQSDGKVDAYELTKFFTWFVMLQFWNLFNARCFGLNSSVFSGMLKNKWFVAIVAVIFIGQLVVVQFGGEFFRTVPLSIKDWAFIVALSSVVLWIGEIWRWIERVRSKNVLSGTPREGMLRS